MFLFTVSAIAEHEPLSVGLAALPPGKGNPHGELIDYLGTWSALFDPLTLISNDGTLMPWLAVSWEQIDPLTWDFALRDDVVFSNGAPFDANAVVEAVRYITSDRGRSERIAQSLGSLLRAVVLSSHRVRLVTNEPSPIPPVTVEYEMTKRRKFTPEFKAKIALEALRGDRTIQEIAARHKVHPNQVSTWKRQAMDGLGEVFSNGAAQVRRDVEAEVHDLHAKIGRLTVERDFLARRLCRIIHTG